MEPPGVKTFERKQECQDCAAEYTATVSRIYSTELELSGKRCPACREKYWAEVAAEEEAEHQLKLAQTRREWRVKSGIAPKFLTEDFSTYKHDPVTDKKKGWNLNEAYELCRDYAERFPVDYKTSLRGGKAYPSLLLYSLEEAGTKDRIATDSWGVGKTHLATAIAHRIIDRWQGETETRIVDVISEPELFAKIQATFSYSQEERQHLPSADQIVQGLTYRPWLVLDDMGKEERKDPQFVQRTLFGLVDGRYKLLRPMVITTNKSPEALRKYLAGNTGDEAVFSRLLEMCGGEFFRIRGQDYRRKG